METDSRPTIDAMTVAPVVPTTSAVVKSRPIGLQRIRVTGGMWAGRGATSRAAAIPHGLARLERVGNIMNLRLAAGEGAGDYRGGNDDSGTTAPFLDSDVYKWLEAVGWELAKQHDPGLLALAEPVIDLLGRAQRDDGYLDSFFQVARSGHEFTDLQWGHELYVAGHLIQAAVAWSRGTGDDRLERIAERFVDRIWHELGPGRRELVDGHPGIEMALVELFRLTGRSRHLELATLLVERRGRGLLGIGRFGSRYWQDHEPVRTATEPVGHAVRQVYLDCGAVDVAIETGDRELLDAVLRRWEMMRASRMYLTGALGSRHRDEAIGAAFELPPDRAYAETCASIGSAMLAWRLLLATGEARFADVIERTAFNGILSGLGADGRHFFYSNPLQRRPGGLEVVEGAATTRRAEWFEVACCPPNLMRFLATFPDLVATQDGSGLSIHQFTTGSIEATVTGGDIRLEMSTEYPWSGDVDILVTRSSATPWPLSMRVPEWCPRATLHLHDGTRLAESGPGNLIVSRTWSADDRVALRLQMEPRVTAPDPRIDALRGTIALERGPLVYAVEDADLPGGSSIESVEVDPASQLRTHAVSVAGVSEAIGMSIDGWLREDPPDTVWPYTTGHAAESAGPASRGASEVSVNAVPYFTWGERPGLGMRVWLPTHREADGSK